MKPLDEFEPEDFMGHVFAFSPVRPVDPEYRQAYSAAQKRWLELWEPFPGDYPQ